jgi:cell division protease FtsH
MTAARHLASGGETGPHGGPDRRSRRNQLDGQDVDQEGPGAAALDNSMERTRFFRRPVVWIILVIIGAIALTQLFTGGPSYQKVDTSVALDQLHTAKINKVVVQDKEQTIKIDLASIRTRSAGTSGPRSRTPRPTIGSSVRPTPR